MHLFTIGFSGKSSQRFFTTLQAAGVCKVIDVRRSNNTLYCGFTRARDLPFLLERICDIQYVAEPEFSPSLELLRDYQARLKHDKKNPAAWPEYTTRFLQELSSRPIVDLFERHTADCETPCLLCTEPTPEHCHRRLVAEYIKEHAKKDIRIEHL